MRETIALGIVLLVLRTAQCDSLKSLHILFRHGERSPSKSYPYDPYRDYPWQGGWNQLSNKGKLEMYDLGRDLRNVYSTFLPKYYFPNDVDVLSSYADRCYMSAQLFLAGMFPPVDIQIWNPDLLWQPIPIRTLARSDDNKIALKKDCPKFQKTLMEVYSSEEMRTVNDKHRNLYEYLSEKSGEKINGIRSVETLYNILEIEQLNGLDLPKWTQTVYPDKMKDLAAMSLAIFTKTDFMKKMHGGELVKEIIENIGNKINGTLISDRKLFLYSGHDLTIVSLMRILGFDDLLKPEFGASVIIEHHNIKNKDVINILYKRNPYAAAEERIPQYCNKTCFFDLFVKQMGKYMSESWEQECKI